MAALTSPSRYHGLYINLDRSAGRREAMESQLARLGFQNRYTRFAAVDGANLDPAGAPLKPGELGAFHSHMRALQAARAQGTAVHILEDDALLTEHVAPVIEEALTAGLFDRFDIVFTDTLFAPHLGLLKGLKAGFDSAGFSQSRPLRLTDLKVIDLAQQNFSCLTSYVVGAGAAGKLLGLYRAELHHGLNRPVDIFIRDCVAAGTLKAGLLFPFITSFRLDDVAESTIAESAVSPKPSVLVLAILRYLFFVGRDLAYAKSCLDAATRENRTRTNAHHDMMAQALEFILSSDFKEF